MAGPNARTVYLPADPDLVTRFRAEGHLEEVEVWTLTEEFARSFGLDQAVADDMEEADYRLLQMAATAALTQFDHPVRWVVAARVGETDVAVTAPEQGRAHCRRLGWERASALFVDEPAATPLLSRARELLASGEADHIEQALALLLEVDLLWYTPDELDDLTTG